jgi:hypothetical protein
VPKIAYTTAKVTAGRLTVINQVNEIIEEYRGAGYDLTLRQL